MKFSNGDTVYFYNKKKKIIEKGIILQIFQEEDTYFINSLSGLVLCSNPISSCRIVITEKNKNNSIEESIERFMEIRKMLLSLKNVMPL